MKRTTIKDIAKLTGLSVSTISRALKGHPDIGAATRDKVNEVASALGYKPNLGARSLRTQSSNLIGVILPKAGTFFFPEMLAGVSEVVTEQGYSFVFFQSEDSLQKEDDLLERCMQMSVEGVLISLSVETTDLAHLQKFKDNDVPVVLMDRVLSNGAFPCVNINDAETAFSAVDFLAKKGHRKILGIFDDPRLEMTRLREAGFRQAMVENDLPLEEKQVLRVGEPDDTDGAIAGMLEKNKDATAVFTMSDKLMVRTYHVINNAGLAIPADMAMIAISDGKATGYFYPNITHLRHSGAEVGRKAAGILFEWIQGNRPKQAYFTIEARLRDMGSV